MIGLGALVISGAAFNGGPNPAEKVLRKGDVNVGWTSK